LFQADSAAALLDDKFSPLQIVASAAVLVDPPYKESFSRLAEPIFTEITKGYEVIVHKAELCRDSLEKVKAEVVHLDMSLGGISLDELSPLSFQT